MTRMTLEWQISRDDLVMACKGHRGYDTDPLTHEVLSEDRY